MEDYKFHIDTKERIPDQKRSYLQNLRRLFIVEKLNNPFGIIVFILGSAGFAWIIGSSGLAAGILILLSIIAIPLIYSIIAFPKFGIVVLLVAAYFIMWIYGISKVDFPLGTVMDALQALLILGFLIKQKYNPSWSLFKEPVGIIILLWISYNLLQFANPTAESRLAWIYTIRTVAIVMFTYFIFGYHIRSISFVRFILKLWICLAFFAALYAYKQEYIGFFDFEQEYLNNPKVRALLYIGGHWRKFSIFTEPVAFSYNMVTCSLLCITMLFGPFKTWKKVVLAFLALFFLEAMLFSGTRGAYVLIPVALILLCIVNFSKKVFLFSLISGVILAFLIFVPTSNPGIRRFQSAFRPSEDASYNVRQINQKRIQPYIQKHPFGGGLGATGVWGKRFAPHSFLSKLPPDSGYVRVAVELGWIGLLLICTLMFIILTTGINNYFRIKDPELKTYCLAMTLIIFAYAVGNFPQEALVQFPSNIYFYLFTSLITVTMRLDNKKEAEKSNSGEIT